MMNTLPTFTSAHAPQILSKIEAFLSEQKKDATYLSPYFLHSVETIEDFVLRGGKNIRSLLVVCGYLLAGGVMNDEIYLVAAGVELFHKHLLNIDDMADRDELRYGGPTLWQKYQDEFAEKKWLDSPHHGRTFSEIDGTLLGSFAFEIFLHAQTLDPKKILAVISVMHRIMYRDTVGGWQLQYMQNHDPLREASEEQFLKGLELVTAHYTFLAPLKIGLILAGKEKGELADALSIYSLNVGRAFQLQDDILGLFGEPDEMGKPVGNDLREGKKTLLLQRAYRSSSAKDQEFLENVCGRDLSQEELERVRKIVTDTGSLAYSRKMAEESVASGITALEKISSGQAEIYVLKDLAHFVIHRKK